MKHLLAAFLTVFFTTLASAQYSRYVIKLRDKQQNSFRLSQPSAFLSQRSIDRRIRYNIPLDSSDLPVSPYYLDQIRNIPKVIVLNTSKWLNQVLINTTDPAALAAVSALPFVQGMAPVAAQARPAEKLPLYQKFEEPQNREPYNSIVSSANQQNRAQQTQAPAANDISHYGGSYDQIHFHEGEYLHNKGFTGSGIIIAILDAGFNAYLTNPCFDSVRSQGRILGEWDYVKNEKSVNEDHPHGAYCFSIIGGNMPGAYVGSAPHAKFYLLRTEDAATEYPVEEQHWVAAAEFADSAGVDMISSSLGYSDFDDPIFNHSYAQRNGNTTIITLGADLAAKKGILVCNSAGNSGGAADDNKYVMCPADGDSVLAVGAVTVKDTIAAFSSRGPNGAGKLKPNIVSVGQNTAVVIPSGAVARGNGTSFSNPLACGLIACLWQAFPEFSNMEIINAVQLTSNRSASPDNRYGYGAPDFHKAYAYLSDARIIKLASASLSEKWLKAFPVPVKETIQLMVKAPKSGKVVLELYDISGRRLEEKSYEMNEGEYRLLRFSNASALHPGIYFIRYNDGKNRQTLKVIKP